MQSVLTIVATLTLLLSIGLGSERMSPDDSRASLQKALDTALDDERYAEAFYEAIMARHGRRRPFSNIVNAERGHQRQLLGQYARLQLTAPENRWTDETFDVPDTFAEACDMSIVAEIRNARLYDEIMAGVDDPDVLRVFDNLRRASLERHLQAFRRHGSGWTAVDSDALSSTQRVQRDRAFAARDAMFGTLLAELTTAMRDGGPAEAIAVCSTRAPIVATEIAREQRVRVGRTSWKLRNPDNTPPVWADLLIDEQPLEPRFFADRAGRLGALTPIRLAETCLQCHGERDRLDPAVLDAIDRMYPADAATGFEAGNLRGWFWMEVPPGQDGDGV